jgi:hypothetical protein
MRDAKKSVRRGGEGRSGATAGPKVSARQLYDEALAMKAQGLKPFQIVKQVLAKASTSEVALSGTLNHSELVFNTGEVIAFDGTAWHYRAADPEEGAGS